MPRYLLSGLTVDSDIELSSLPDGDPATGPQVCIRLAADSEMGEDWEAYLRTPGPDRADLRCQPLPGLRLRIRDGDTILVHRSEDIPDSEAALYLVGLAWGLLCHQRGLLPLHCSAVSRGELAFAFSGASGDGKSTLAAALARRGLGSCCDDLAVLDLAGPRPRLHGTRTGVKLWEDAVLHLGLAPGERLRLREDRAKFRVPQASRGEEGAPALEALYMLEYGDEAAGARLDRLCGSAAWSGLYRSVYGVTMTPWIRSPAALARQIDVLARTVRVYRFTRPRGFHCFEAAVDLLAAHIRADPHDTALPAVERRRAASSNEVAG